MVRLDACYRRAQGKAEESRTSAHEDEDEGVSPSPRASDVLVAQKRQRGDTSRRDTSGPESRVAEDARDPRDGAPPSRASERASDLDEAEGAEMSSVLSERELRERS